METNETIENKDIKIPETKKHQYRKNAGIHKQNKFLSWLKGNDSDFVLFVILLVLINLVGIRAFLRFDLTGPKSYSLSQASKEVVKTIDQPLSIKVFFSSNLPSPFNSVDQYVRDILVEYKNSANSNFNYEFFDMNKPENQQTASSYGLQQIQIQEVKNNDVGFKNVFMGLVFTYADQIEKLDGITSASGLEYNITTTISKIVSSANLFTGLTGNVQLTLYRSSKLNAFNIQGFNQIDSRVKAAYDSVNKKNFGRIDFNVVDPSGSEVDELVKRYGIQSVNWKNKDGSRSFGAIGLVLEYGDNFKLIPLQMVNMIFANAISGLDELEDNLSEGIKSLVLHTSSIGYLTGNGEMDLNDSKSGAANFRQMLGDLYTLDELNPDEEDIPSDMQCIIVNGPKTALSETALYKLDQFIMRGGNVLFFMDPFEQIQNQNNYYGIPQYEPIRTGLEKLFSKYGIEFGTNYVMDENCFNPIVRNQGRQMYYFAPMMTGKSIDSKHPVTRNLNNVIFLQAGSIDVSSAMEKQQQKVTVLLKSSDSSWKEDTDIILHPDYITPPADKSMKKSENLAVLLEGRFDSAFTEAPAADDEENESKEENEFTTSTHLMKSTQNGKIFAASTSYITGPQLIQNDNSGEPIALFLHNIVDYMNGNQDLCTMRTKNLSMNTLEITTGPITVAAKYFNEFGLAVLVAIAGLIVLLLRQKHRKQIRLRYDPSDSRETADKE